MGAARTSVPVAESLQLEILRSEHRGVSEGHAGPDGCLKANLENRKMRIK